MRAVAGLDRRVVDVDGVPIAVHAGGAGPAVVLLHGWCGSAHTWRHVVPLLLADGWAVVVLDQRGYGESGKPDSTPSPDGTPQGGYDAVAMAGDVAVVLDALGQESAFVVGHYMGAPVALAFGAVHADRALGVGYVDEPLVGVNEREMTTFSPEAHGGFWQFGVNWIPGLPEILYAGHEEEFLRFIFGAMTVVGDAVGEDDVRQHAVGMTDQGGLSGWVGWYRAVPTSGEQLRHLAVDAQYPTPVCGLGGEHGVAITHEQLRQVRDDVAGGIVPRCGHLVPEEAPQQLVDLLVPFMREHERRRPQ